MSMFSGINLDRPLRHDIRSHLNSIQVTAEAMVEVAGDPRGVDSKTIKDLADQQISAVNIIQNLLDLTKQPTDTPPATQD